jgi:hypothetical protein
LLELLLLLLASAKSLLAPLSGSTCTTMRAPAITAATSFFFCCVECTVAPVRAKDLLSLLSLLCLLVAAAAAAEHVASPLYDDWPAGQASHEDDFAAALTLPDGHAAQTLLPKRPAEY